MSNPAKIVEHTEDELRPDGRRHSRDRSASSHKDRLCGAKSLKTPTDHVIGSFEAKTSLQGERPSSFSPFFYLYFNELTSSTVSITHDVSGATVRRHCRLFAYLDASARPEH
jgi:hypothetical protein